jgi:hypothetical protein
LRESCQRFGGVADLVDRDRPVRGVEDATEPRARSLPLGIVLIRRRHDQDGVGAFCRRVRGQIPQRYLWRLPQRSDDGGAVADGRHGFRHQRPAFVSRQGRILTGGAVALDEIDRTEQQTQPERIGPGGRGVRGRTNCSWVV